MKLAVLANEKDSFVRPLAEGLGRMTHICGAHAEIHYDGLEILSLPIDLKDLSPRSIGRFVLKSGGFRKRFDDFLSRIADADAIVVVTHVPASHSRHAHGNIERIRKRLPGVPIAVYDMIHLPTVEKWGPAMLQGDMSDISPEEKRLIDPKPFGMERYDWYLTGSAVSEIPLAGPHPLSRVGVDINDGTLFPEQDGKFHVLVDFEQTRKDYPAYREVQLEALNRSGVSFEVLDGPLTRDEIRAKYRRAGALMLAHRESFGLPICEAQACGALIFTPRSEWAGAHWLKDDLSIPGPGQHSPNFVVYRDTVDDLVEELLAAQDSFDPAKRVDTFLEYHPHLYQGDKDALADFLSLLESGVIHSRLHLEHADIGR